MAGGFKDWNVGEVLSTTDQNKMVQHVFVAKSADQTVSGTTKVNDTHLFVSVLANKTYYVDTLIFFSADPARGVEMGWTVPSGSILRWSPNALSAPTSAVGPVDRFVYDATGLASTSSASTSDYMLPIIGMLKTAGTAGTLQFRWSQFASGAPGSILRINSYLRVTRLN